MASKLLNDEFQKHICLDFECTTIEEAIRKAGDLLVQCGCIKPPYIDGMIRREQEHSTHIGFGVMIPHGTEDTLDCVISPGISILFGNRMDTKCQTGKTDHTNLKLLTSNSDRTYWW